MRADQYERLKVLSEGLTDVVLVEADPATWSRKKVATGKHGAKYFNGDRNLYWRKKQATATLNILTRIHALVHVIERQAVKEPTTPDDAADKDVDQLIRESETEVGVILERLKSRKRDD